MFNWTQIGCKRRPVKRVDTLLTLRWSSTIGDKRCAMTTGNAIPSHNAQTSLSIRLLNKTICIPFYFIVAIYGNAHPCRFNETRTHPWIEPSLMLLAYCSRSCRLIIVKSLLLIGRLEYVDRLHLAYFVLFVLPHHRDDGFCDVTQFSLDIVCH